MKTRFALLLILLAPSALFAQTGPTKSRPLVITHVTVIDMTDGPPKPDMTVVVIGNRIAALGKTGKLRAPRNAQVVDASGKYLIPGLWDMHIHSDSYDKGRKYFPRFLAMGITGIRDMGTPLDDVLRLRREIDEGKLLGPRMVVCGPLLVGPLPPNFPPLPLILEVKNVSEARQAVRSFKARGVDFIKVTSSLPRETYFAVAAEAKRQSIPFAGHIPPSDRANLHDELAMFVQAGLTPKEALQAATINPAKYFHKQASLGAIERGKIADMVLLEANPLEDIGNAKRIAAVVVNGRYLSKDSLQKNVG